MGFSDHWYNAAVLLVLIIGIPFYLSTLPTRVWMDTQGNYVSEIQAGISQPPNTSGPIDSNQFKVLIGNAINLLKGNWILLSLIIVAIALWLWSKNQVPTTIRQIDDLFSVKKRAEKFSVGDEEHKLEQAMLARFYAKLPTRGVDLANDRAAWHTEYICRVGGLNPNFYPSRLKTVYSALREAGVAAGTPFRGIVSRHDATTWVDAWSDKELNEAIYGFNTSNPLDELLAASAKKGEIPPESLLGHKLETTAQTSVQPQKKGWF
jgi:hypothetical protein